MTAGDYLSLLGALLSTTAFGAVSPRGWRAWALFGGALAGATVLAPFLPREAAGIVSAIAAARLLWKASSAWIAPVAAGIVCAAAVSPGTPLSQWLTAGLASAAFLASWAFARHPGFSPTRMREEALAIISLASLVVAAVPGVAAGWHSAIALNVAQGAVSAVPWWVISLGGTAMALGCVYQSWRRAR
jgi:hypothetical protein